MKKLILSAAFLAFVGTASVNASEVKKIEIVTVKDSVIKTPIKLEELPEAITAVLKTEPYNTWTPTAAFSVKDGTKEYFWIDAKKEDKVAVLKFDKDGKPVE